MEKKYINYFEDVKVGAAPRRGTPQGGNAKTESKLNKAIKEGTVEKRIISGIKVNMGKPVFNPARSQKREIAKRSQS